MYHHFFSFNIFHNDNDNLKNITNFYLFYPKLFLILIFKNSFNLHYQY